MNQNASDYLDWNEGQKLIESLLSEGDKRMALLISTGLNTGLRWSDLAKLTYSDILKDSIRLEEKKTGKYREITINDEFKTIIARCLPSEYEGSDKLFANHWKSSLSNQYVNSELKKLKLKYNLSCEKFSLHSLRKGLGRRVWNQFNCSSEGLIMLQQMFGHSSPEITLIYLGIRRDEIKSVYLNLNK